VMTVTGFMEIPMGIKIRMPDYHDGDDGWAQPHRVYRSTDVDQCRGYLLSRKDAMWRWWQAECVVGRMNDKAQRELDEADASADALVAQHALGDEMAADIETEITWNEREAARRFKIYAKRSESVKRTWAKKKAAKEKENRALRAQYHRGAVMAKQAELDIVDKRMDEIATEVGRYVITKIPPMAEMEYCEKHNLYRNPKSLNHGWMCRVEVEA